MLAGAETYVESNQALDGTAWGPPVKEAVGHIEA